MDDIHIWVIYPDILFDQYGLIYIYIYTSVYIYIYIDMNSLDNMDNIPTYIYLIW